MSLAALCNHIADRLCVDRERISVELRGKFSYFLVDGKLTNARIDVGMLQDLRVYCGINPVLELAEMLAEELRRNL